MRKDVQFPVLCHYKVIAETGKCAQELIEKTLREVSGVAEITVGTQSTAGKYTTYNADIIIPSLEIMRQLDKKLCAIDGVKVVL